LYLSDRARERIEPTSVGWISVETPWDFEDREQPFKSTALAWESGTGSSALFYGLEQSLKLLNDAGSANINAYLSDLTDYMCDRLVGMEYDVVSSRDPAERSAITCIKHSGGRPANEIANTLDAANIVVSPRADRLRIAPHFYNNREDIDRLIDALHYAANPSVVSTKESLG
jgi:selenocysteine lyase/cysteine desulfurase